MGLVRTAGVDVRLERMLRPNSRVRPARQLAWRLAAILAIAAQCWIALAPLSESRGFGLSAHVENTGNHSGHFTHDAANCPACTVLSLHVLSSHPAVVPIPPGRPAPRLVATTVVRMDPPALHASQPRAPPSFV